MALSNYPQGFPGGLMIRNLPLAVAHPGNIYWIDSVRPGGKGTWQKPYATIAQAQAQCLASRGDIIVAKPGHTETITAAAGIALAKAGIALVGLGSGSLRPTLNFTTAVGADLDIDAANITIANFLFTGGIDDLTGPIDVNAADFTLLNCEFRDVTGQAQRTIVGDANADRLLIDGYYHNGAAAAGSVSAIDIIGADNPEVRNFKIVGNFSGSAIEFRTTASVDVDIHDGYIWNKNSSDLCVKDTVTGTTGKIGPHLSLMLTDNAANITEAITGATFHLFGPILVCNLAGEQAMAINTTASTDA